MSMTDTTATRAAAPVDVVPELVASLAVIVLAIYGLAGAPSSFLGITTIVFGVALLLFGGEAMATIHRQVGRRSQTLAMTAMGGWSTVFLAGFAGIVLGVLALLDIAATSLVSIALIVFGGAFLISSRAARNLQAFVLNSMEADPSMRQFAEDVSMDATGLQMMAGVTAIILGILAITGIDQTVLVFVGLLELGCASALASLFVSESFVRVMQRA